MKLRRRSVTPLVLVVAVLLVATVFFVDRARAQDPVAPLAPPDAAAGATIYQERCANCHGPLGMGDGPLAKDLPTPPAAHGSPEYLLESIPAEMFAAIGAGVLDKGMPPFGATSSSPLQDSELWNLVAAIYSIGIPLENFESGQEFYLSNCVECHGETGAGDGPSAGSLSSSMPDLADLEFWSAVSDQSLIDNIAATADVDGHELVADELAETVRYMRTFSFTYFDVQAPFRPLASATVTGTVTNGTLQGPVVDSIEITLEAFDRNLEPTYSDTTTLDPDGAYLFELADVPQDWFYRVSLFYDEMEYGSNVGRLHYLNTALELPVVVFEKSTDSSAVVVDQLHVVIEFSADYIEVGEFYVISNSGDSLFIGESGNPDAGTIKFYLPEGAESPLFQRIFGGIDQPVPATEIFSDGETWYDTLPLQPGESGMTLLVNYRLPYGDEVTISHPVAYPVLSAVLVMESIGPELVAGNAWQSMGEQALGDGTYVAFGHGEVKKGEELSFTVEGKVKRPAASTDSKFQLGSTGEIALGGAGLLAVVAIAYLVIRSWRAKRESDEPYSKDELVAAIAALDDEFEAGEIEATEYEEERALLMDDLKTVWSSEE